MVRVGGAGELRAAWWMMMERISVEMFWDFTDVYTRGLNLVYGFFTVRMLN